MIPKKTIQIPATTTNLGAGFDALGLALKLFLRVEIQESAQTKTRIQLEGEGARELPASEENLIFQVMRRTFEAEGQTLPNIQMHVFNQIPVARGLGSSAAAIVAGIGCFEAMTGRELGPDKFFRYALEFETHPDNLAAARYGGFTISAMGGRDEIRLFRSIIAPLIQILLVVPDFQLQTEKARAVIPRNLSLCDAIFNIQRSSLTVAALLRNEFHLLREGLCDKIHQPYRAALIPGLEEILCLQEAGIPGLLGVCLSGAGPSILAFVEFNLGGIYQQIETIFMKNQIRSKPYELEIDNQGRTIS